MGVRPLRSALLAEQLQPLAWSCAFKFKLDFRANASSQQIFFLQQGKKTATAARLYRGIFLQLQGFLNVAKKYHPFAISQSTHCLVSVSCCRHPSSYCIKINGICTVRTSFDTCTFRAQSVF